MIFSISQLESIRVFFKNGVLLSEHYGIDEKGYDYKVKTNAKLSYVAGIDIVYPVNDLLNFRQSINLTRKGASHRIRVGDSPMKIDVDYRVDYLEIPLLLEINLIKYRGMVFSTLTGNYFSYRLKSRYSLEGTVGNLKFDINRRIDNFDDFDYGVSFGFEIKFANRLFFHYLSNIGFNFISYPTTEDIFVNGESLEFMGERVDLRNQSHMFTLGYIF